MKSVRIATHHMTILSKSSLTRRMIQLCGNVRVLDFRFPIQISPHSTDRLTRPIRTAATEPTYINPGSVFICLWMRSTSDNSKPGRLKSSRPISNVDLIRRYIKSGRELYEPPVSLSDRICV